MQLGVSKRCITPQYRLRLCGFASRSTLFDKVEEDIFLRVHLFCENEKRLIFIYGDLLWWNPSFVERARIWLCKNTGLRENEILFTASHNHCGPPTGEEFSPLLELDEPEYTAFLLEQLKEAVNEAEKNIEPVTGRRIDGTLRLNVYRRKQEEEGIVMAPNYDVPADSTLTVLEYCREDGSVKAIGVHYPCHANICGDNIVQPDYPGVALRLLEENRPQCVSFFWQGCTADLRPNCVIGGQFERQGYHAVINFANQLVRKCEQLLAQDGYALHAKLSAVSKVLSLSLQNPCDAEKARAMLSEPDKTKRAWAQTLLKQGCLPYAQLEISRISLAEELVVYTFSAEMSQYYADFVRKLEPGALCIAYTNGMTGYICTAQQIYEGGYEPCESILFFGLAGTFPASVEKEIQSGIRQLSLSSK